MAETSSSKDVVSRFYEHNQDCPQGKTGFEQATGSALNYDAVDIFRVEDGEIAERRMRELAGGRA